MRSKRFYTFVIAGHANGKLRRFSVSHPLLLAVALFAMIGVLASVAASYHYGRMVLKVMDYDRILAENDDFRAENHNYKVQTAQLGEKVGFLDATARKLMVLSGMHSESGLGGVGGYSRETFSKPSVDQVGSLKALEGYRESAGYLEGRYRGLNEVITEQTLIEAARPSFLPVKGYVNQGMGNRNDPFNPSQREYHPGIDISAPYGTRVVAPADGRVVFVGRRAAYGNMVVIDHRFGLTTRYGHLSKMNVKVGQRVNRHDVIGYVGNTGRSTGPHLHFEIWVHKRLVDPLKFLASSMSD
jgi:murein DD-endopeptidase MepM/ murein hydrolase activator NlpD